MGKGRPRSATMVLSPGDGHRSPREHGLGAGWAKGRTMPLTSVPGCCSVPLPGGHGCALLLLPGCPAPGTWECPGCSKGNTPTVNMYHF